MKDVLALFDPNTALREVILGDTCHSSAGFLDEKILSKKPTISELLDFDYDFRGLVAFEASLSSIKMEFISNNKHNQEYLIKGNASSIEALKNKLIEENAYHPDKYKFSYDIVYSDQK